MVRYRPEIDGLRAIAVTAVITNHFDKDVLASGHLGVDVFFVLSGYVITLSLLQARPENLIGFASGFYARRIKRLAPGLVLMVLASSLAICLVNPQPIATLKTAIAAIFGFSNFYLLKTGSGLSALKSSSTSCFR